ncbi:MAG: PIN/TRAM domain-containing protein [Parachlamydiaceae bacterium]
MNLPLIFARITFFFISILLATSYSVVILPGHFNIENLAIGLLGGTLFFGILFAFDLAIHQFNLRQFNVFALGLFFGYLMGLVISSILSLVIPLNTEGSFTALAIRSGIFIFTCYLGVILTVRSTDELYLSIPFVRFKPSHQKKKDILLDISILTDPRIIDLATSGLLDHHVIFPRFALKELYYMADNPDENIKAKARKSLEVIKKLESIPHLDLRYLDKDFPEIKDVNAKLTHLARALDANIITADINRVQISEIEGIRVININFLSNALKPITSAGECLNIKIQRYGKEPRQGVGYLDDGTMVVVNGGAEFIGETIRTQVLSVKHTSSGRMIFCNAAEDKILSEQELQQSMKNLENTQNNYYSL